MEWQIVTVIVVLVGLVSSLVAPIIKLTRAITTLTVTVGNLEKQVEKFDGTNDKAHCELRQKDKEQDETINDHEVRIGILESHPCSPAHQS